MSSIEREAHYCTFQRGGVHVCAEAWPVGPDTDENLGRHRKKPEVV